MFTNIASASQEALTNIAHASQEALTNNASASQEALTNIASASQEALTNIASQEALTNIASASQEAHARDGVALCSFMCWLEGTMRAQTPVTGCNVFSGAAVRGSLVAAAPRRKRFPFPA